MFSVSPEIYNVLSQASRWLFAFFALMLLLFAFTWHRTDRKERRERFKNLPGAGTVGELIVLSGSDELRPDTWFPVPREGVLGSLRSCDLVIPCPGVRSQHLDFSWQDGTGLMIRPRVGCEAYVDGVPVTRSAAGAERALLHGSLLQVGSAVLRLQLFSALADTNRTFTPAVPSSEPAAVFRPPVVPPAQYMPPAAADWQTQPFQPQFPPQGQPLPPQPTSPQYTHITEENVQPVPEQPPAPPRRRRSDAWKEDWSE